MEYEPIEDVPMGDSVTIKAYNKVVDNLMAGGNHAVTMTPAMEMLRDFVRAAEACRVSIKEDLIVMRIEEILVYGPAGCKIYYVSLACLNQYKKVFVTIYSETSVHGRVDKPLREFVKAAIVEEKYGKWRETLNEKEQSKSYKYAEEEILTGCIVLHKLPPLDFF